MNTSLLLAGAHLRNHQGKATLIILILLGLIFLPLFILSNIDLLQHQLRERARKTPLLLSPAKGQVETILHHLHFQWENEPPSFTPSESFELFDDCPLAGIPMLLFYELLSQNGSDKVPLLATAIQYLNFRELQISKGRAPQHPGEVILGGRLAQRWQVELGDYLMTAPHRLLDLSKAHQLELKVVGILKSSGQPEDQIAITLQETAWIKMGLGHGHAEEHLKGVPESLHLSLRSEQEGYRRIGPNNQEHFHFHQAVNLLPLSGMILLPSNEEQRLFALAWGQKHPGLEVLDPAKITERILASLHRLGDLLLVLLAVVSFSSLILMGLLLRMDILMRKKDSEVLEEQGIPTSTFFLAILAEWVFYLAVATLLSLALLSLNRTGGLPLLELLALIRD